MDATLIVYGMLFLAGAVLGSTANALADRLCWTPRFRSPWRAWPVEFLEKLNAISGPTPSEPVRRRKGANRRGREQTPRTPRPFVKSPLDFVPILGWISLSRLGRRLEALPESDRLPGLDDRRFWVRPFCVELLWAPGLAWLYHWEVERQMLLPGGLARESWETTALRFGVHVVFLTLLLIATLTDLDDMTISDALTVPGTLLGLALAALLPQTLLPATELRTEVVLARPAAGGGVAVNSAIRYSVAPQAVPLNLCSPNSAAGLFGKSVADPRSRANVAAMMGLWLFWCFAMLRRVWYARLPFRKAAAIFCRHLKRDPFTKVVIAIALLFPCAIVLFRVPFAGPASECVGLFSALVGMATGMSIIWGVRLVAGVVLGREAMGFGDVTLMGMVGAFVGWQSCLVIFFLAPFLCLALIALGALSPFLTPRRELPYGPGLCLATAIVVIAWGPVWSYVAPIFELGWIVGVVMLICLVLLGVLLGLWRWIRDRLFQQA